MTAFGWTDLIGIVGVAMILLAYFGLQLGKLDGQTVPYSTANALGAALILVSLRFDFNLSAFVIELFWLAISLVGLARGIKRHLKTRINL